MNFSEHFNLKYLSHFHLNFWPGEVVILLRNFFLILPNDPLGKVCVVVGQVSSVVVVPIQVHMVANARYRTVPPSPQVEKGTIDSFKCIVVSILG